MTESTKIDYVSIVQDLRDEADLCRNETATDIADLLDDAASCIVAMKSQFTALRSDLAAAQEARQADEDRLWSAIGGREAHWIEHHDEDGTLRRDQLTLEGALIFLHDASERSQRAEALSEEYRQYAERYRWLRDDANFAKKSDPMVSAKGELIDGAELDAAIDAAIAWEKK